MWVEFNKINESNIVENCELSKVGNVESNQVGNGEHRKTADVDDSACIG